MEKQTRLSINLSAEPAAALRHIVEKRNITLTEVIRRAISTLKFIDDAVTRGAKVYIRELDGTIKELTFTL